MKKVNPFRQERQRFSLRKYNIGLASVLIGCTAFLIGSPAVQADDARHDIKVDYRYVVEGELSDQDKANLKQFVANQIVPEDQSAYYFVYKEMPASLPKTGQDELLGTAAFVAGASLMVLAVYFGKKDRKILKKSLIVLSLGGLGYGVNSSAVENVLLAPFNQSVSVTDFVASPPQELGGYQFTGYYLVVSGESGAKEVENTPQKETIVDPKVEQASPEVSKASPTASAEELHIATPADAPTASSEELHIAIPSDAPTASNEELHIAIPTDAPTTSNEELHMAIPTEAPTLELPTLEISPEQPAVPVQPIDVVSPTDSEKPADVAKPVDQVKPVEPTQPLITTEIETVTEYVDFETIYQAAPELDAGKELVSPGRKGEVLVTKTYKVIDGVKQANPTITKKEVLSPQNEVIRKGTKQTIRTVSKPLAPQFVGSETMERDASPIVIEGQPKVTTFTTTYSLDPKTGLLTSHEDLGKVTDVGQATVTTLGIKPKIEIKDLPFNKIQKTDAQLTYQKVLEDVKGITGQEVRTTRYSVDPTTGRVTSLEPTVELKPAPTDQVTRVGTLKDTPALTIKAVTKDEASQTATVEFALVDPHAATEILKARLSTPDGLAKEVTFTSDKLKVTFPALMVNTDYTISGLISYNVNKGLEEALVTYSDKVRFEAGQFEPPLVTYAEVKPDENNKSVTITHNIQDKDSKLLAITTYLYGEDGKVIGQVSDKTGKHHFEQLDYYTNYKIKTVYDYDLGQGKVSRELAEKPFVLEYKKLEVKDADSIELYSMASGKAALLDKLPADYDKSKLFVKIKSDHFKEWLLPVESIKEETVNGRPAYWVTAATESEFTYQDGKAKVLDFTILKDEKEAGVIYSFKELVDKINQDRNGTYTIGADLDASEVVATNSPYISSFTGTLTSKEGQSYSITNLKQPLFGYLGSWNVADTVVKNINLSSLDITIKDNDVQVGSLAKRVINATISNVHAKGKISAVASVGGLLGNVSNSKLSNISFEGDVVATNRSYINNSGGLVAIASGTSITKSQVNAQITFDANDGVVEEIGGIVGKLADNSQLTNSYFTGSMTNRGAGKGSNVGILVGTSDTSTATNNIVAGQLITAGTVTGQNLLSGSGPAKITNNFWLTGLADGLKAGEGIALSPADLEAKKAELGLQTTNISGATASSINNSFTTDYSAHKKYQAKRALLYQNMEKLLPLYNVSTLVYYANQVPVDHKLNKEKVLSVTPMVDNHFVTDVNLDKAKVNQIAVHYADGTMSYMPVTFKADFKDTKVAEYTIKDLNILYTPETRLSDYSAILSEVLPTFEKLSYFSQEVKALLGASSDADMELLYLKDDFDRIKGEMGQRLTSLLSNDRLSNVSSAAIKDYLVQDLKDNAAAILLGLSYLDRWYNIDFGDKNIKNLMTASQDFYGDEVSTLESIKKFGQSKYANFDMSKNVQAFINNLKDVTNKDSLFDFLNYNVKLFTDMADPNDWFKATTKAKIAEYKSTQRPDQEVRVYQRLQNPAISKTILPLLTADEGIYVISNMTTVSFGMYERYTNMAIKDSNPSQYAQEKARVEGMVDRISKLQGEYLDFWYRVGNPETREKLLRLIPNWDGYQVPRWDGKTDSSELFYWRQPYGANSNEAMRDFFGPIREHYQNNGTGAYANGERTNFVGENILEDRGSSVYTHEMVHNTDGNFILGGLNRRDGSGPELFAQGLLQSLYQPNDKVMGINSMFDMKNLNQLTLPVNTPLYHNQSPERFQTTEDLNTYVKGMVNLVHLLELAEAEALVTLPAEQIAKAVAQLSSVKREGGPHELTTGKALTAADITAMNLQTSGIEGFVRNNLISQRGRNITGTTTFADRNKNFESISLFNPIWSAIDNPTGMTDSFIFKRMAWEMFAAKGYLDGFAGYTSNKLLEASKAAGNRTLTDRFIVKTLFNGQYETFNDYKVAQYKEVKDQTPKLKTFSFTYEGKAYAVNSYQDMVTILAEMSKRDLAGAVNTRVSHVFNVKELMYHALYQQTNEYRESIFNK